MNFFARAAVPGFPNPFKTLPVFHLQTLHNGAPRLRRPPGRSVLSWHHRFPQEAQELPLPARTRHRVVIHGKNATHESSMHLPTRFYFPLACLRRIRGALHKSAGKCLVQYEQ